MAAIDTNVLVRLVVRDDLPQYGKAFRFVNQHRPVLVTHLSILELAWVLMSRYGHGKAKVSQAVKTLLEMREFSIQQAGVLDQALRTWEGSRADFADCFILESVKAAGGTPLATFDRLLGRQEGCLRL